MTSEFDDDTKDLELSKVIGVIKQDYPLAVDYRLRDGTMIFEILDENDLVLAEVSEQIITRYWNMIEDEL